jgi:hypothetical protein
MKPDQQFNSLLIDLLFEGVHLFVIGLDLLAEFSIPVQQPGNCVLNIRSVRVDIIKMSFFRSYSDHPKLLSMCFVRSGISSLYLWHG